jgi:hypothetical protein
VVTAGRVGLYGSACPVRRAAKDQAGLSGGIEFSGDRSVVYFAGGTLWSFSSATLADPGPPTAPRRRVAMRSRALRDAVSPVVALIALPLDPTHGTFWCFWCRAAPLRKPLNPTAIARVLPTGRKEKGAKPVRADAPKTTTGSPVAAKTQTPHIACGTPRWRSRSGKVPSW